MRVTGHSVQSIQAQVHEVQQAVNYIAEHAIREDNLNSFTEEKQALE